MWGVLILHTHNQELSGQKAFQGSEAKTWKLLQEMEENSILIDHGLLIRPPGQPMIFLYKSKQRKIDSVGRPGIGFGHPPVPLQHNDFGPDLIVYALPFVQYLLDVFL